MTVTVNPVNDEPVAVGDAFMTDEDTPLNLTASDLLANDTDVDGNALTLTGVGGAVNGSVVLDGDGNVVFTPDHDVYGAASFEYMVTDGEGGSDTGLVTVTINPINDVPVAADDTFNGSEDAAISGSVAGNDIDPDGPGYTAALVSDVSHGSLTLDANGSFTYTPDADWYGSDQFTYSVTDGVSESNMATVTLSVAPVNDAPVAGNNDYTVDEDAELTVGAPGLLGNDSDVDSISLSVVFGDGPAHGTVTGNPDGSFTYMPNANFNGTDSFTYRAFDGQEYSDLATVTLMVNAVNDGPTADPVANATVAEGQVLNLGVTGHDVDGDTLSYSAISGPGSIDEASGAFTWTADDGPATQQVGVRVSDGHIDSFFDVFFDIAVTNVAPTLNITGGTSRRRVWPTPSTWRPATRAMTPSAVGPSPGVTERRATLSATRRASPTPTPLPATMASSPASPMRTAVTQPTAPR